MTDEEVRKLLLGSPDLAVADHVSLKDAKELLGIPQTAILREVGARRAKLWSRVPAMAANGYCTDIRNLVEAEGIPGTRPSDAMDVDAGDDSLPPFNFYQ